MRSGLKSLVALAAALLFVPSMASADEMGGNDMQELLGRMADMEQQLRATNDALAAANARVEQLSRRPMPKPAEPTGLMPKLSSFLTETTFDGWVSASYFYNTNNPDNGAASAGAGLGGANAGASPLVFANPFHTNSNSFQVDQAWFSMENEATAESRGGFEVDLVWGETADVLGGAFSNANAPYLYTANVSYLAPITGAGIKVTAGRFATHVGAEVAEAPYNFNITRGLVYAFLQPINHTGVKISSEYSNGVDWMLGVANTTGYGGAAGFGAQQHDDDDAKAFLWRLGYRMSEEWAVAFNGLYGGNCPQGLALGGPAAPNATNCQRVGSSNDEMGLFDMVVNWDPSDKLSTWLNFDYVWLSGEGFQDDPWAWGIALAGRYAVTDSTGFALRGEYVYGHDNYFGFPVRNGASGLVAGAANPNTLAGFEPDTDLWSITATVDHAFTEHLSAKAELVYQAGFSDKGSSSVFFFDQNATDLENDQVLLGVQMTYEF